MNEEVLDPSNDDPDGREQRTAFEVSTRVSPRQKEALSRALSGLDVIKRKGEPEVAEEIVSRHLDRHTNNRALPLLIARFLDTHWRSYMRQLYFMEGAASNIWKNALENTENLTWSLLPKSDDQSRQRLYGLLPDLFQWLHAVLRSQQVPDTEEDTFFAELARLQVAALHADPASVAESATDQVRERDSTGSGEDALTTEPVPPADATPAEEAPDEETNPLRDLVVGRAVEFQSDRARKRILRLEWISRGGGVYLFRDQRRGDSLCLTADRCVECFRDRSLNLLR